MLQLLATEREDAHRDRAFSKGAFRPGDTLVPPAGALIRHHFKTDYYKRGSMFQSTIADSALHAADGTEVRRWGCAIELTRKLAKGQTAHQHWLSLSKTQRATLLELAAEPVRALRPLHSS